MHTGFVASLSFPEPHSLTTLCCKLDSVQASKLARKDRIFLRMMPLHLESHPHRVSAFWQR